MSFLHSFLDFFLNIDTHLGAILVQYGTLTYAILFAIIFGETGLVIAPLLPGDSLLFAVGAFAARGDLNVMLLLVLLSIAAICGDAFNFFVGRYCGDAVLRRNSRWIKREHLEKTHRFFRAYGGKTIVIARFMPIVRTLAPFVAGVGRMSSSHFFAYNVIGGLLWVFLFLGGGYFFGTIPFVERHFSIVILLVIFVSMLPGAVGWMRSGKRKVER